MDELHLASFVNTSGNVYIKHHELHFEGGGILESRKLILNFADFPWESEYGFSIGFWLKTEENGTLTGCYVF